MTNKSIFISLNKELLSGGMNIQRKLSQEEERVLKYRNGIRAAMLIESKTNERAFFEVLNDFYALPKVPLLTPNACVTLYIKFSRNKAVMECLLYLAKSLKGMACIEEVGFWEKCISNLVLTSNATFGKYKQKLDLFVGMGTRLFDRFDYSKCEIVFRFVLNHTEEAIHFSVQRYGFVDSVNLYKFPEQVNPKPLWEFFQVLDQYEASIEVYERVTLSLLSQRDWSFVFGNNFKSFCTWLLSFVPIDKLRQFECEDYRKLHFIFGLNPAIIEKVDFCSFHASYDTNCEKILHRKSKYGFYARCLIREIFMEYKISFYFCSHFCFNTLSELEMVWLKELIRGKNLSQCAQLPFRITKAQAHAFNFAPYPETVEKLNDSVSEAMVKEALLQEFRDRRFVNVLVRQMRDLNQSDFWINTSIALVRNGLKSSDRDLMEIFDYINHQVFELNRSIDFKKKKLENLRREVETWHREIQVLKGTGYRLWKCLPDSGIKQYSIIHGDENYVIRQLNTNIELLEEGKSQHHCVGSYARNCIKNGSFIFSLRKVSKDPETEEPLETRIITIEVNRGRIIQQKGRYNRSCEVWESELIDQWREANGLVA
ncbi:MAG: hypothetical protein EB023_06875 [Flavobacteriia bacterium]|nr:hypothetical protein [Flavobacteriia bacterium]